MQKWKQPRSFHYSTQMTPPSFLKYFLVLQDILSSNSSPSPFQSLPFAIVAKYTHHKIYYFNVFHVYSLVALIYTVVFCNHHHHLSPELFDLIKLKPCIQLNNSPFPPPPSPWKLPLLSGSMNLTTLGPSYECNHTICVLSCLAYFT